MPRIPERPISRESHISNFRLAKSRLSSRSVAKATPTRIIDPGGQILARTIGDIGKAVGAAAEYFRDKEELVRVSSSQKLQMGINDTFRDMWMEDSKRTGSQAIGMLDELRSKEEDLKTLSVPEGLDTATTQELTEQFNRSYTRYAEQIMNHVVRQSEVANKEALLTNIQNAHMNIGSLNVGDAQSVDEEVEEALRLELERNPNLTESQIETNRRAFKEDFMTFAVTKWMTDSPIAVTDFWDNNKKELQKALPKMYNRLNAKMEVVRDDARYDMANAILTRLYPNDLAARAEEVEKNPIKYFGEEGHYEDATRLAATWRAKHNFKVAEEERVRKEKADKFFTSANDKYRDRKTGVMDAIGYIDALDEAERRDTITTDEYNSNRYRVLHGEFSLDAHNAIVEGIRGDTITTDADIFRLTAGLVRPEPYQNLLKARKADLVKGLEDDYFRVSREKYMRLSAKKPSQVGGKDLVVDAAEVGRFMQRLEDLAKVEGYSSGDPRIQDLAEKMLEGGSYGGFSVAEGVGIAESVFTPGEAPWYIWGETQSRRWQHEIATGGSPTTTPLQPTVYEDPWMQKAYDTLKQRRKIINDTTLRSTAEYLKGLEGDENAK